MKQEEILTIVHILKVDVDELFIILFSDQIYVLVKDETLVKKLSR